MFPPEINTTSAWFAENQQGGLMVCGINWGGDPDVTAIPCTASFFSDAKTNNWPYRNRVVRWFSRWGHPLETDDRTAGPFERSIIQTNWLSTQSKNMSGSSIAAVCAADWFNFSFHLEKLRPRVVMFTSVALLEAMNSPRCLEAATSILGPPSALQIGKRDVNVGGKRLRRFRFGRQQWGATEFVAVPHPTGSKGLSDDYVASGRDLIDPILAKYKSDRGFAK